MPEVLQPDDHLSRLLAPAAAEIPWYKSLYQNIHELIKPEKLPPLVVTSKPVPVRDIWGLYGSDPKSRYISVGIHVAVFALLMFGATNKKVQQLVKEQISLIDPNLKPYVPDMAQKKQAMGGGGGGGAREPLPVSKGNCPSRR